MGKKYIPGLLGIGAKDDDSRRKDLTYVAGIAQKMGGDPPQPLEDTIKAASIESLAEVIDLDPDEAQESFDKAISGQLNNGVTDTRQTRDTPPADEDDLYEVGESFLNLPSDDNTKPMKLTDLIHSITSMYKSMSSDDRLHCVVKTEGYGSVTGVRRENGNIVLETD